MKTFKGILFVYFCFVLFSGSVDAIVFSKTGNHLPQCLWFSNSFFTVDGCIDCVRGILNSQVSILWYFYAFFGKPTINVVIFLSEKVILCLFVEGII